MANYKLLGELIHYCTKCKLDLNHMITVMKKDQPGTILCQTCKTPRQYRAPKKLASGVTAKRSVAGPKSASRKNAEENTWKTWLNNESKTPKNYSVEGSFRLEDIINHPTFGRGVVVGFVDPGKMQVFFYDTLKLLMGKKSK
jgi:hypothetical protein